VKCARGGGDVARCGEGWCDCYRYIDTSSAPLYTAVYT